MSPSDKRPLRDDLRRLDDAYGDVPLGRDDWQGMQAAVAARRAAKQLAWPRLVAVAVALVLVAGFGLHFASKSAESAGFVILEGKAAPAGAELRCEPGIEVLARDVGVHLASTQRGRLRRAPNGVRVVEGTFAIQVDHVQKGAPPVRIEVSRGALLVIGTRFTVTESGDRGEVTLHEGRLRWVALDGTTHDLQAGDSLRWPADETPVPVAPEAPQAPETPRPPKTAMLDAASLRDVLAELDRLRLQQDFAALAQRLEQVQPRVADPQLRDALAYERCDVLGSRLSRLREACRCVAKPAATDSYRREQRALAQRLGCPTSP